MRVWWNSVLCVGKAVLAIMFCTLLSTGGGVNWVSMAVVIRLQGLSISAGSQDIRKFFGGLRIPDGGVHIVGGELEEAFIIFGSDEDARIAMTKSGDYIKGSPVKLLLSSKTEMQNILERSSMNLLVDQRKIPKENPRHLDMGELRGSRRSAGDNVIGTSSGRLAHSPMQNRGTSVFGKEERLLLLRGMPFAATEKDVRMFFAGLVVDEVVLLQNSRGQNNGNGVVTFASKEDASNGLKRHKEYIGTRFVEVYTAKEWQDLFSALPAGVTVSSMSQRQQRSPQRSQEISQYRRRSRSPVGHGPSPSSSSDYCVLVENMPPAADKRDIMKFFGRARLESDQILYLPDDGGSRTRSAFVLFKSLQDYRDALDRDNKMLINRVVGVRPISREKMMALLKAQKPKLDTSVKNSIHVKFNILDVRKAEVMDFFSRFNLSEKRIFILRDDKGNGLGEALVSCQSEEEAREAFMLNGRRFLGSEVRVRIISDSEMQDLINPSSREDRYGNRNMRTSYDTGEADVLRTRGSRDFTRRSRSEDRDAARGDFRPSAHDGPTCIKLVNLPFNIKVEEVYDFCYGYKIIPGSVSLQYDKHGNQKGTATVVFESRQEALNAIDDLTGRPIGPRKIQLVFL